MRHNEVILKTIEANESAQENEKKKLAKLEEVRKDLVKAYKIKCYKCNKENYLKDFIFIQLYSVDMDSDWDPYEFKYCKLECPACISWNSINEEIRKITKEHKNLFKQVIEMER